MKGKGKGKKKASKKSGKGKAGGKFAGEVVTNRETIVYRGIGFPDQFCTTLRYAQDIQFVASTYQYQIFQSSLHDPDFTGTGHQPMYYDQLVSSTGPYNKWQVLAMSAVIEVNNNGANPGYICTCWSDSNSSVSESILAEQKHSVRRAFGPNTGSGRTLIRTRMSASTIHGYGSGDILQIENQYGQFGGNPNDPFYLLIAVSDVVDSSSVAPAIRVTLEFKCRFFERVNEIQSLYKVPPRIKPVIPYRKWAAERLIPPSPSDVGPSSVKLAPKELMSNKGVSEEESSLDSWCD